jgi:Na+/melibiose symporter-like transporter
VPLIVILVLSAALGIFLGVMFNMLVIKNFSEAGRKTSYANTVVIFLLIAVILTLIVYGKIKIESNVKDYSNKLEQDIISNYSNLDFIKNGIDMAAVNNDISGINKTVSDLNVIIKPQADELGIPNFVYNSAIGYVSKELQKKLFIVNAAGKAANSFVNDKNFLTVSSLINGLRTGVLKIVNTVAFVLIVICAVILGIYILASLSRASKERNAG